MLIVCLYRDLDKAVPCVSADEVRYRCSACEHILGKHGADPLDLHIAVLFQLLDPVPADGVLDDLAAVSLKIGKLGVIGKNLMISGYGEGECGERGRGFVYEFRGFARIYGYRQWQGLWY